MNFNLSMEDYTIILNALHYYKQVEKRGQFQAYDHNKINALRDKMAKQLIPSKQIDLEQYKGQQYRYDWYTIRLHTNNTTHYSNGVYMGCQKITLNGHMAVSLNHQLTYYV